MRLIFWRREQIQEAKDALEQSRSERPMVERVVRTLFVRGDINHFAPMIEEAFKLKGGK